MEVSMLPRYEPFTVAWLIVARAIRPMEFEIRSAAAGFCPSKESMWVLPVVANANAATAVMRPIRVAASADHEAPFVVQRVASGTMHNLKVFLASHSVAFVFHLSFLSRQWTLLVDHLIADGLTNLFQIGFYGRERRSPLPVLLDCQT